MNNATASNGIILNPMQSLKVLSLLKFLNRLPFLEQVDTLEPLSSAFCSEQRPCELLLSRHLVLFSTKATNLSEDCLCYA